MYARFYHLKNKANNNNKNKVNNNAPLLFSIVPSLDSKAKMKQKQDWKSSNPLFADDMLFYMENLKKSVKTMKANKRVQQVCEIQINM